MSRHEMSARVEALRKLLDPVNHEFETESKSWKRIVEVSPAFNITGALKKVLVLAQLVSEICLKDSSAYFDHIKQLNRGPDEALNTLRDCCRKAYAEIAQREAQFKQRQSEVLKAYVQVRDFIGRFEALQKETAKVLSVAAVKNKSAIEEFKERKAVFTAGEGALREQTWKVKKMQGDMKEKYRVNDNLLTGLNDWFSRKDDKFNLGLALGIGKEDTIRADEENLRHQIDHVSHLQLEYAKAYKKKDDLEKVIHRTEKKIKHIEEMTTQTQVLQLGSIKASADINERKVLLVQIFTELTEIENSMERFEDVSTLPKISEMSKKLLSVVVAAARYQKFEPEIRPVNEQIFAILQRSNDWEALLEDNEVLEREYKNAVSLVHVPVH